jgi:hypothetical protein
MAERQKGRIHDEGRIEPVIGPQSGSQAAKTAAFCYICVLGVQKTIRSINEYVV